MSKGSRQNQPSRLLNQEENNRIFSLLGRKCVTLATTVAQLYFGNTGRWVYQATGVLCFVRDANVRSFFFRFYEPDQSRLLFEQEIYRGMRYNNQHAFFHQFEADDRVVGFNFVDANNGLDEAHELANAVKSKVEKLTATPSTLEQPQPHLHPQPQQQQGMTTSRFAQVPQISVPMPPTAEGSGATRQVHVAGNSRWKPGKKDKNKGWAGKGRLRPEDIGVATNFRHVLHVGADNLQGGGIQRIDMANDPQLKYLFGQFGQDLEATMRSENGQQKVEKFVESMGGIDNVHRMAKERGYESTPQSSPPSLPPTLPSRSPQQRGPPPPLPPKPADATPAPPSAPSPPASPAKSPAASPAASPARSPSKSFNRSPAKSFARSPARKPAPPPPPPAPPAPPPPAPPAPPPPAPTAPPPPAPPAPPPPAPRAPPPPRIGKTPPSKSPQKSGSPSPAESEGKQNFLSEIQGFKKDKLKTVDRSKQAKREPPKGQEEVKDVLRKAMANIRPQVSNDDDDEEDDD